ncbi:tyrosine-type recombinase/integrase [Luedemannella flava]
MAWVEKRGDQWRVRFRSDDGSVATDSSHPTKTAANARARAIETDQRRDVFISPEHGKITLAEWVDQWLDAHDVGAATFERYRSHLDNHILPRFGTSALNTITRMAVKRWVKDLNQRRADSTVASILSLLSMIMGEAVEERRIPMNPCRRLRHASAARPERPWASAAQVNEIAARVSAANRALIITAAYTGMRWGELTGLRRPNCKLDDGRIFIDPDDGALHEVGGHLELGPPKTPAAVRDILLPPFLIELLHAHLKTHDHEHVFIGRDGGLSPPLQLPPPPLAPRHRRRPAQGRSGHHPGTALSRPAPQPQNLAHRRRRTRDRSSQTARPPPARHSRHLQPRQPRRRKTPRRRTARRWEHNAPPHPAARPTDNVSD